MAEKKKKLVKLATFNMEHRDVKWIKENGKPKPNGILCPVPGCGGEMMDTKPLQPTQVQIYCSKCLVKSRRMA